MAYVALLFFFVAALVVAAAPQQLPSSKCNAVTLEQFHTCGEELKDLGAFVGLESVLGRPAITNQQRLWQTLFENYEKSLRPVLDSTVDVINATLNPALVGILRTNEADESITIVLKFRMIWNDVFMRWNQSDYGGIQLLRVPVTQIWVPDIYITNTYFALQKDIIRPATFIILRISITQPIQDQQNLATIGFDGSIVLSNVQVITITCIYDIFMFPFDIQNCSLVANSHVYEGNELDITHKIPTDLNSYNQNSEWDLISMTGHRLTEISKRTGALYPMVHYDIVIQRKPIYFVLTFVVPCFMITATTIIGIFSPFNDAGDRGEKITMGLTSVLAMAVILTVIAQQMPKSSQGMPLLGIYIMAQVGIAAVSCLMAAIVMYQQRKWTVGEPIPAWILTITQCFRKECNTVKKKASPQNYDIANNKDTADNNGSVNAIEHLTNIVKNTQSMVRQVVEDLRNRNEEELLRHDWKLACLALDNLLMLIFLICHCILTVSFLIIGYLHQNT